MPKLSVVLPSWGRYDLTLRMLNSISLQTFEDYELFFLGDACQIFEKIILSEDFKYFKDFQHFKTFINFREFELFLIKRFSESLKCFNCFKDFKDF